MTTWIDVLAFAIFGLTLISSLEYSTYAVCECHKKAREKPTSQKSLQDWRQLNIVSAGVCVLFILFDLYLKGESLWN